MNTAICVYRSVPISIRYGVVDGVSGERFTCVRVCNLCHVSRNGGCKIRDADNRESNTPIIYTGG